MREVVNGPTVPSTGCQWRAIPKDLPPRSTVYDYFDLWSWDGTLDRIHDGAPRGVAKPPLAKASPTAAMIDSQSVKSAERVIDPPGCDAGKKIKGKKRHVLVDTQGLLMHAIVHAADLQDRDGGALPTAKPSARSAFLVKLYADGGYQGPEFQSAMNAFWRASTSRSSSHWVTPAASSSCPSAGSSNAPSLGLAAAADGEVIGNASTARRWPSSAPRLHPPHAAKTMQSRMKFPERLSAIFRKALLAPRQFVGDRHPVGNLRRVRRLGLAEQFGHLGLQPRFDLARVLVRKRAVPARVGVNFVLSSATVPIFTTPISPASDNTLRTAPRSLSETAAERREWRRDRDDRWRR